MNNKRDREQKLRKSTEDLCKSNFCLRPFELVTWHWWQWRGWVSRTREAQTLPATSSTLNQLSFRWSISKLAIKGLCTIEFTLKTKRKHRC